MAIKDKVSTGQITQKQLLKQNIISPLLPGKKLYYGSNPYTSALSSCQKIINQEQVDLEKQKLIRQKKFGAANALDCDVTVYMFKMWTKKMIEDNYYLLEGCGDKLYNALIRDRDDELIRVNKALKKYYNTKRKLIDYDSNNLMDMMDNYCSFYKSIIFYKFFDFN